MNVAVLRFKLCKKLFPVIIYSAEFNAFCIARLRSWEKEDLHFPFGFKKSCLTVSEKDKLIVS